MARIARCCVLRRINHTRNETKRLRALNVGQLRAEDIVNYRICVVCAMLALLTVALKLGCVVMPSGGVRLSEDSEGSSIFGVSSRSLPVGEAVNVV